MNNDYWLLFTTFLLLVGGVLLNYYNVGANALAYRNSMVASFFVAFGHYLRKRPEVFEKLTTYSLFVYPISIFVLKIFRLPIPTFNVGINVTPYTLLLFVLLATTGSLALLRVAKWINHNRLLEYIGRNTLTIYCLHFIPLYFFVRVLWEMLQPVGMMQFINYLMIVYLLEYVTCLCLVWLFNKYPLAYAIGKRKER